MLTRRGGRGMGAEARASEDRSQGDDWGWLHQHSLKGLVHHSYPGGSPGKSLELPKRQEIIVSGCARRGDSEHPLNELQRQAQAMAISADPRDGQETLRLLPLPPRSLCASTGHSPHHPSWEPVQPTTARVPWSRDNFLGRTHGAPQAAATSRQPLPPQARPALRTPPSPGPGWATAPESAAPLTPSCLSGNRRPQAAYTQRRVQIQSWTPGAVRTKKRKGKLFQQLQEQRIKSPQSTWCTLHLWNTRIDNKSSQNWGGGLWEQL